MCLVEGVINLANFGSPLLAACHSEATETVSVNSRLATPYRNSR